MLAFFGKALLAEEMQSLDMLNIFKCVCYLDLEIKSYTVDTFTGASVEVIDPSTFYIEKSLF